MPKPLPFVLPAIIVGVTLVVWATVRLPTHSTESLDAKLPSNPWFRNVSRQAGITFTHFDPATPEHLMPETLGSGVAWIDYDADGWPDLFCVQDCPLGQSPSASGPTHRMYRNNRDGTFTDETERVGLAISEYGVGAAVGDYDNDGFDDLLVTKLGGLTLYHNELAPGGGRRFVDVTAQAGLPETYSHWATSAAWVDLDGDGLLDLYVCNYVEIDPAKPITCRYSDGTIFQCSPTMFPNTSHRVYRNTGSGFVDVSAESGVSAIPAPGLGVVATDLDDDGKPDLFVANDLAPQFLWRNESALGHVRLVERAGPSGCSRTGTGLLIAGMGVDIADIDKSGRPSVIVTNFQNMGTILFENRGTLLFVDASLKSGLAGPSLSRLGFGVAFLDADRDCRQDVIVANGHVHRTSQRVSHAPYRQPIQFFLGNERGHFGEVTSEAGEDLMRPMVGRGLARCDFDNDGREDFVVSGVGDPVALFRNEIENENHWITLELIGDGKRSNRNAIGATVTVQCEGREQRFWIKGGGSYLSANDRRLQVGLGSATESTANVTVKWPSGRNQVFAGLNSRAWWRLHEGQDLPERFSPPPP